MKNFRNTLIALFITLNLAVQAKWPGSSFLTSTKMNHTLLFRNMSTGFVQKDKSQKCESALFVFVPAVQMDKGWITLLTKKTESGVVRLLNLDFKVKFRLNRNMNIIFSYN